MQSVIVAPDHYDTHTVGRTPLDERSALRRDLYLTIHNIHNRQASIPRGRFEPEIPASERRQTRRLRPRVHRDRFPSYTVTSFWTELRLMCCYRFWVPRRKGNPRISSVVFGEHEGRCQRITFCSSLSWIVLCNLLWLSVFVVDMSESLEELSISSLFCLILWYLFTLANLSSSVLGVQSVLIVFCIVSQIQIVLTFSFVFLLLFDDVNPIKISAELRPLYSRMWCHRVWYFDTSVSEEITASFFKFQERVFNEIAAYKASCRTTPWPLPLPPRGRVTPSARRNIMPETRILPPTPPFHLIAFQRSNSHQHKPPAAATLPACPHKCSQINACFVLPQTELVSRVAQSA